MMQNFKGYFIKIFSGRKLLPVCRSSDFSEFLVVKHKRKWWKTNRKIICRRIKISMWQFGRYSDLRRPSLVGRPWVRVKFCPITRLKNALRLKKVCYKVFLCENCQRQNCKAFIGLTNCAKIIGGGWPLAPEILDDRVGAKLPIFDLFSLVAPQP